MPETTETKTQTPDEMIEALKTVQTEAREMIAMAQKALDTATNWLAGEPAYDFSFSGSYARQAGDLEAAIATHRAYRLVAHKLVIA